MTAVAVALGGSLGALARYMVERVIAPRQKTPFPLSTLVVNVSGSVALGALVALAEDGRLAEGALAWAGVGFCGAYTTFSTFTYETLRLIETGAWRYATLNFLLSFSLPFGGAWMAYFAIA